MSGRVVEGAAAARYRWPGLLACTGLLLGGVGLLAGLGSLPGTSRFIAAWLTAFAGAALLVAGVVTLLFTFGTNRSFEWFLAWRYLKRAKGNPATLIVGVSLLVLAGSLYAASVHLEPDSIGEIAIAPAPYVRYLKWAALAAGVLGWLVAIFGVLQLSFSVFTSISGFGVHLGTGALVVVLSVMGGFEQDLRQKILGTRAHVVVSKPNAMFTDYRQVLERAGDVTGVGALSPYIESEVMLTSQTNHEGVLLRGIDPHRVGRVTDLARYLRGEGGAGSLRNLLRPERLARIPSAPFGSLREDIEREGRALVEEAAQAAGASGPAERGPSGNAAAPPTRQRRIEAGLVPKRPVYPGIIVGAELARNLRLYVGDDVNLVAPLGGMSPAGPIPKSRPFRVAGIFYSGMYEFDTKYAYTTIPEAQRFLGLDDEISGIEVKAQRVEAASLVAKGLASRLGPEFEVRDWQQLNQKLFSALKLEKLVMFLVLIFIVLVASFSIVTNLVMVVLEKSKEIAALKALGASSGSIFWVFTHAGLYIGVIGMLVGLLQGVGICIYLKHVGLPLDPEVYYISSLPVTIDLFEIGGVAVAAVLLSGAATIYPALRAASLQPIDGLRHE